MLESFSELCNREQLKFNHLLIGNGFSINIINNFSYKNLYDRQKKELDPIINNMFELLRTNDYEEVLREITKAGLIGKIHNLDTQNFNQSYEQVKNALLEATINAHHQSFDADFDNKMKSNNTLSLFDKSVFTTNYDLITYLLFMEQVFDHKRKCNDFFRRNNSQLIFKKNYIKGALNLYYLHGGLHLYESEKNETVKIVNREEEKYFIHSVIRSIGDKNQPLFVSEGQFQQKMERIMSNEYLKFCYESLKGIKGNLTIYGHELNEKVDAHLVKAIQNSNIDVIAFGIYLEDEDEDKERAISKRITEYFPDKKVYFFNSKTFFDTTSK